MKHVMLTFFGLILLYSLFFNDKKNVMLEKEMNRFHENSSPSILLMPDSSCQKIPAIMPYEGTMLFASEAC